MSAELAQRLLSNGVVPPEEVDAALLDVVTLGVPLVQALIARSAMVGEAVERELSRIRIASLRSVRVSADLAEILPVGICERLLAVPVGRAASGEIEIACVDPLDPAVGTEFAHQYGVPVRVVRASLAEVLMAIERWLDERDAAAAVSTRTPAFGTRAPRWTGAQGPVLGPRRASEPPARQPSAPPFPLVRRSIPARDTDPGVGLGHVPAIHLPEEADEAGEPVLGLFRSKPPPRVTPPGSTPPPRSTPPPEIVPPPRPDLSLLERADAADAVVDALLSLCAPLARAAVVFAAKPGGFEARAASPSAWLGDRPLRLPAAGSGVIDIALSDGHYLGRLPDDSVHAALNLLVANWEVYVVPVMVSQRPALVLMLTGLLGTFEATRGADELARAAGKALERIVREKKQRP